MDEQENASQRDEEMSEKFDNEKEILKKRHFRLKLYEYCFRILYGNSPLRQITDSNFHQRSQSLDDQVQTDNPKASQRNESFWCLEQKNNQFLDELTREIQKAQMSAQVSEERRKRNKESQQVFDDLLNNNPDVNKEAKNRKSLKEVKKSSMEIRKENGQSKEPQPEAPKPKFEFLRKSNYKKLDDAKAKHYYTPKKYQVIHSSTSNIMLPKPVTTVPADYSKRFSSIPVVSQRTTSLAKRKNIVEREIEEDRQALKEIVATKSAKSHKSLTVAKAEAKTPADTERSWISDKQNPDHESEQEDEVNFERSWSAWSLKKAELLDWDPDFDYQPVGPQEKKIRQKFYKSALIKESSEIERKRKVALENTMLFAKVREDQIMKSGSLPRPPVVNKTMKLPVNKLKNAQKSPVKLPSKDDPKLTEPTVEDPTSQEEPKEEERKTSLFGQIKKALQNVPEKLKDLLSFGDTSNTEKGAPKRASSITEITSDSKRHALIDSKPTSQRPSSAGDVKKCSKRHSLKHKPLPSLDLHKHNLKVDSTLCSILITKPKQEVKVETREEKMPEKLAKLAQQRRPISWRSTHELDKINSAKQQIAQKRQTSSLPKLPQIPANRSAESKAAPQPSTNVHLVPIPKQKELFDPIGNPYRSAGRKYSPIPVAGWPPARSFNPEVGRCKIIDFIEQNWEYKKPQLSYRVEHFHAVQIENNKQRFKYRVYWTSSKTEQEGIVYFNVDVSRIDSFDPIELTYRFQGQHHNHRAKFSPTATPYRKRWIKSLADGQLLTN